MQGRKKEVKELIPVGNLWSTAAMQPECIGTLMADQNLVVSTAVA